jgi:hypothetical protein
MGGNFKNENAWRVWTMSRYENSKAVIENVMEEKLKRMPHTAYSPDSSPCDFFLFGYLQDRLIEKKAETPDESFCRGETIIFQISNDMITRVFLAWHEKLRKGIEMRENYIE